ncbi:TetR/AcrR family transcriptional regulator [Paenibacillus wulumuqiensis]|uniref:TetR/AcrR family transcriptional regulator n=1 Tax=Paenibacillus wulumuqiensis TaxID=1567107 RepID=UPI0006199ADD|nr:TetR/AcrR family transcriptional regulator [Paenibacillus wulumuqiensis]
MKEHREDPRVLRTRTALHNALKQLMQEQAYDKITIQDITKLAAVNRKTFYLHYESKDHLLYAVTDEMLDELFGEARDAGSFDQSVDELQRYIAGRIFEYMIRYRRFFEVMFERKAMFNFVSYMKRYIARFYEEKFAELDDDKLPVHKDVIASYISSAYVGIIHWWLENGMPYTPEEMTEQMILLNSHGPIHIIRTYKGED